MMKIRTRSATALFILSTVAAACGGTSATSSPVAPGQASAPAAPAASTAPAQSTAPVSSAAAIDACALVTEPEATAFLGSDPGPGVNTGTDSAPACAYSASLIIAVDSTDGPAQYTAKTGAMQGSGSNNAITGVGDAASATIVANTIADMEILKGSVLVSIEVQGDPSLQNITVAALTKLGTMVVGRL
jgi:hypothetical protein